MKKFVVLGTQRTGTTLIVSLLNSLPQVLCIGEAFHKFANNNILNSQYAYEKYKSGSINNQIRHWLQRKNLMSDYLDNIYSQSEYSAIGFVITTEFQPHLFWGLVTI